MLAPTRLLPWIALLLACAIAPAPAQEPSEGAPILLRAAHLFDAASGELLHDQEVLVRGERILAVGARGWSRMPRGEPAR